MATLDDPFSDEDVELAEDEDDDDSDEEHGSYARRKAYALHLPKIQNLLKETFGDSKPNLLTEKAEKCCAICPTPQWFKGWKALLAHAETFKKKKFQQHRGYGEAIKEALRAHGTVSSSGGSNSMETRTASFDPESLKNHVIVWPPIVSVEIVDKRIALQDTILDFLESEIPKDWVTKFIAVRSSLGLLVFRGEAVGYLEAKSVSTMFRRYQKVKIYGHLLRPHEMEDIDPDRKFVNWCKDSYYLRVQKAQKKDKEEHENERAKLKEMERTVESLAESENKVKDKIEHFQRLLVSKHKETENLKRKAEEMENEFLERMQRLEVHFQNEIKVFEATSAARLKRWREQLQENEKRLEKERVQRMKEIEGLQKKFKSVKQDIKQKEVQKALEKELEVMQRKKNFVIEMANAEASFNELARKKESDLQAKQHIEEMKLMEDSEKERAAIMDEWLEKHKPEKGKRESEPSPSLEEEVSSSCCMCTDPLVDGKNRAVLPCGHARLCLECADLVFESDQPLCPFCRRKITKKPIVLPKMFE